MSLLVTVAGVLLAAMALGVQLAASGPLVENYLIVNLVLGTASWVLGIFLVVRLPGNVLGRLFALAGGAYLLTGAVTAWLAATQTWDWPGMHLAAWFSSWIFLVGLGTQITLLFLLFPDGKPPSPRWRPAVWASVSVIAALVIVSMVSPSLQISATESVDNPIGIDVAEALLVPLLVLASLVFAASVASLVARLNAAEGSERRRIAPYVGAATVVLVALLAVQLTPVYDPYVQTLALPLLPASATLCVLRYRLYDLEFVVRRSLVWLGLSIFVVAGYAVVVEATANLLRRQAGLPESLIAAAVIAAAFQPVRLGLQHLVSRALYGQRNEPEVALRQLGQTVAATAEPAATLRQVTANVAEALAAPWVAVEVIRSDGDAHITESGRRPTWADPERVLTVPLVHAGEPQGSLQVCRRSPNESLSARDRDLLQGLAYPVAAAAAAFRSTDDLRRSREALVVAREDERQRLRRDLHDELGPLLASVTLQLDTVTLRAERTGTAPTDLIDELRATVQQAIATVRRTVENLRPPTLDELGLVAAVSEQSSRLQSPDGPRIDVSACEPLPSLSAASEVAAYRIAIEAVTNAVRHACPRCVTVRFDMAGTNLVVVVTDDGRGLPAGLETGFGLRSIRDRAEEFGGTATVSPGPLRGTVVEAHLPTGRSS
jgi:signal transduction histidine kinase